MSTPTITPAATQNVTYPQTTSTTLTARSNSTGALTYYLNTSGATTFGNASVTTSSSSTTTFVSGNLWVAAGSGSTNSLAYSSNGTTWTGLGTSIFGVYGQGRGVAWNGTIWVAVGYGSTNHIAYSSNGTTWTGLGTGIFSFSGNGVAWNGTRWVAVGNGTTHTIAYSNDGTTWTGLGNSIFGSGWGVAWNGTLWVAVGNGFTLLNSIAYSNDGIVWTGVTGSANIFSSNGFGVAWNGTLWVAVGYGTHSIAYSNDGTTWTGLGESIFSLDGQGLAWNGTLWVAVGNGSTHTIAYSNDGTTWTGLGKPVFGNYGMGNSVAWNGTLWVAVGERTNSIAYSSNGTTWTGLGLSIFSSVGYGVASNAGYVTTTSYNGNVSITGPGTITAYVTEAADSNYAAITTPVTAGTINVQGPPTITPATTQSVGYPGTSSVTITPTSNSAGAFTFSLQAGFPAGTSINSSTGVVTIGGLGTINILVTQAAAGIYTAVTTPVTAGTINVVAPTAPTITPNNRSVVYPVTQLFIVTNNGAGSYAINGNSNPTLNLFRGITYYFDLNASGHPFWIKTSATTGTGDQYNDGVTNNGTQTGRITFSVPFNAPNVIYYICQLHGSMQGIINISDFATTVTPTSTSAGAFTFSLQAGFPAGTSINSSTGALIIGGLGTINVLVTQAFNDIYAAVTTPVAAGTITVTPSPTPKITPNNHTVIYTAPTSITISPTSTNTGGVFNFSLQDGFPAGTSIVPSTGVVTIGGIGTIVVLVTQTAAGIYSAVTTPVVGGTITVTNTKTATITPTSDSQGTFTYSLDTPSSAIASINANTGVVTVTGFGTINVYVTQDSSDDYTAVTTPVLAGSIISLFTPTITPAATQNATYLQTAKVTVTPTSDSTGAFTFSLQPGYLGCTTVDPNTGVVTIGGTGTITVLVTQAATSSYGPVTTPAVAGTIIVDFSPIPCFKEGTQILTLDGYRYIQDLRKGDLVKTLNHGYVGINMIGCQIIYNRKETIFFDKIYKCTNTNYPEIFEDLYITGLHAVLVDELTDEQQRQIKCVYNDSVYITDDKYRLPVCFDERAKPHETDEDEQVVIFHLALDHKNENLNYGIYANGLLVETTSIRLMAESGLIMIE